MAMQVPTDVDADQIESVCISTIWTRLLFLYKF